MSPSPKVCLVIPTKDRLDLLKLAVESIRAQTVSAFEALIVDDHSSDDTRAWVRRLEEQDPRFRYLTLADDRSGAPAARNHGLRAARAPYIIFLDSDDALAEHCLEQRLRVIAAHPELDFAVFPCQTFRDMPGDERMLWNLDNGGDDLDRFLDVDVPWQTTSPIWRRESLERIGGWDERATTAQDWEFHIRSIVNGLKYARFGRPDCFWRRASGERDSIGKSSALEPKFIRSRLDVAARITELLAEQRLLTDKRRRILAGLFFRVANRLSERSTRCEARDAWREAYALRLLTLPQYWHGKLYFYLCRWHSLRPWLRRVLEMLWPAEMIKRPPTVLQRAPMPEPIDSPVLSPARAPA